MWFSASTLLSLGNHRCLNTLFLANLLVNILQSTRLDQSQGQELCDEIANMLLNTIEAQNIDDKVEAAVNVFLTRQGLDADPSSLASKLSWSIKVRLEQ